MQKTLTWTEGGNMQSLLHYAADGLVSKPAAACAS